MVYDRPEFVMRPIQSLKNRPLSFVVSALLAMSLVAPLAAQEAAQEAVQENAQPSAPANDGPNIYPTLAADLVERGAPVLDVRSEEEVAQTSLLAGATRISHDQLADIEAFIGEDKNRAVVLYCGSGRRASRVVEALREQGYGGLVNAGGYEDLAAALDES